MIVTCPDCSTRYSLDPRALGSAGRTVRCANCGKTWREGPPPDAPRRLDPAPVVEPELVVPEDRRVPPAGKQSRAAAPAKPRSRAPLVILAVLLGVLALALGGAVVARDRIVALWPDSAELYARAGLHASPPGPFFEIRKTTPSIDKENGVNVVVVEGEIANVSGAPRDVPKLKIVLKDKDDHEVEHATVDVHGPRLLPGAAVPFRATVPQPATPAAKVVVMIAEED